VRQVFQRKISRRQLVAQASQLLLIAQTASRLTKNISAKQHNPRQQRQIEQYIFNLPFKPLFQQVVFIVACRHHQPIALGAGKTENTRLAIQRRPPLAASLIRAGEHGLKKMAG